MIISAMEAGRHPIVEAAIRDGWRLRVQGLLRLFSEPATSAPRTLYTRDVHARADGIHQPKPLPLGYGGTLDFRP